MSKVACMTTLFAAVFIAISHWMHNAAKKPKAGACTEETAHQLAQCVRFPMLSNDFLHFVVSQVSYRCMNYQHISDCCTQ